MTSDLLPTALFGLPLVSKRADTQQLVNALTDLWVWQMQRPLNTIEEDLDALRSFFDPLATGKRLRTLLAKLPPTPAIRARLLRPPLVLGETDNRLITLEGRAALDVLQVLLAARDDDPIVVDPDLVYPAEHRVYERYQQWSLRRIADVLALQSGKAEALRLPSIGLLLLLLVNGSYSPRTALRTLLDDQDRKARVDEAVSSIVASFCTALDERPRDPRHFVLYSGYPLTEARRRLPTALRSDEGGTYILSTETDRVLALVAIELRRPQRSFPTAQVLEAYDQLVVTYRRELPVLAALEMSFEQRSETRRLRQQLEMLLGNDSTSA